MNNRGWNKRSSQICLTRTIYGFSIFTNSSVSSGGCSNNQSYFYVKLSSNHLEQVHFGTFFVVLKVNKIDKNAQNLFQHQITLCFKKFIARNKDNRYSWNNWYFLQNVKYTWIKNNCLARISRRLKQWVDIELKSMKIF